MIGWVWIGSIINQEIPFMCRLRFQAHLLIVRGRRVRAAGYCITDEEARRLLLLLPPPHILSTTGPTEAAASLAPSQACAPRCVNQVEHDCVRNCLGWLAWKSKSQGEGGKCPSSSASAALLFCEEQSRCVVVVGRSMPVHPAAAASPLHNAIISHRALDSSHLKPQSL